MGKIMKNLLPYWRSVLLIMVLLFIQAFCDLALPQYTSNIIDTGIIGGGIESALPKAVTAEEFQTAQLFMTEEERAVWTSFYEQDGANYSRIHHSQKELETAEETLLPSLLLNYQLSAVTEDNFRQMIAEQTGMDADVLSAMSIEEIGSLMGISLQSFTQETEDADGNPVSVTCIDIRPVFAAMKQTGAITEETFASMRENVQATLDTMGSSLVRSMGIAYAARCHTAAGIDGNAIQTSYLWKSAFKMAGVALLMAAVAILTGFIASRVGASVGRDLRDKLFSRVIRFSSQEMDRFSTASLITRATNDVQQIQFVSVILLRMLAYAPILGIGGIIKVAQTGAGMSWVIVLAVLVILAFVMVLVSLAMPKFKIMQKLVDRVNLVSREILTGLSVIRAFGREEHEEKRFDEANRSLTKTNLFTNRTMAFMMPGMTLIMNGLSVLIIWVGAHRIDSGVMQVGTMTAFITYSMMIVMSFLMLTMMSIMLPRAAVAAERMDEVLKTDSSILNPRQPQARPQGNGQIAFHHVSFRYPGADENALTDIDFTAEPGTTTAIIGSTGSGKSTLVNLIPRLYDVTGGDVTLDGADIRSLDLKELRAAIGMVPQKAVLFSGTIASNICYSDSGLSAEAMKEAASIAQASDFIEEKKMGYNSPIAQGGSNVSGGQKQRLSIARAIASNPDVYIFDDSFSALDLKTDAALRRALGDKVQDRTVIIVAQRISTILHADQILVLDEGRIVGKGTHEELLASCEVYRQIARSQLSEAELGLNGNRKEEIHE